MKKCQHTKTNAVKFRDKKIYINMPMINKQNFQYKNNKICTYTRENNKTYI